MTSLRVAVLGDEAGLPVLTEAVDSVGMEADLVVFSGRRFARTPKWSGVGEAILLGGENGCAPSTLEELLRRRRIDLLVCFSFDQIISERVLEVPRLGSWNLHGGRLPIHRGANALNWVLIRGEIETAMTMHRMVAEVDAGEILKETPIAIPLEMDAVQLRDALTEAARQMLPTCLHLIGSGSPSTRAQDPPEGPPFRRRRFADGRIDWRATDLEIHNLIRGLVSPWPGAWTVDEYGDLVNFDRYLTLDEVHDARMKYDSGLASDTLSGDRY